MERIDATVGTDIFCYDFRVVDGQVYTVYPKNDNLGNMLWRSSEGKYPELVTANFFVLLLATIMDVPNRFQKGVQ